MRWNKANTEADIDSAFPLLRPNAAGLDVASREHYVAVPAGRDTRPVRSFGCTTSELKQMAEWLKACGVDTVAIEATGVYWVPIYEVLEDAGIEAFVFDGRQTRHVSGRKTDVLDCQWSQKLHSHGLWTRAFRPDKQIATLRAYWRQRGGIVESCARQIHLMHKALEEMNIQLHKAVTDITGVTGMRILRAIVAGERDVHALAALRRGRIKATTEEIARALEGTYRQEHMFALAQALEAYDFFQRQLADCSQALERHLARMRSGSDTPPQTPPPKPRKNQPNFDLRKELARIAGVDVLPDRGHRRHDCPDPHLGVRYGHDFLPDRKEVRLLARDVSEQPQDRRSHPLTPLPKGQEPSCHGLANGRPDSPQIRLGSRQLFPTHESTTRGRKGHDGHGPQARPGSTTA